MRSEWQGQERALRSQASSPRLRARRDADRAAGGAGQGRASDVVVRAAGDASRDAPTDKVKVRRGTTNPPRTHRPWILMFIRTLLK